MYENEGVGGEVDTHTGVDVNADTGAVHYGWLRGTTGGSGGDLYQPQCGFTRTQYTAIIDAAQQGQSAWESYLQTNHATAWAWLYGKGQDFVDATYEGDRLLRGL